MKPKLYYREQQTDADELFFVVASAFCTSYHTPTAFSTHKYTPVVGVFCRRLAESDCTFFLTCSVSFGLD